MKSILFSDVDGTLINKEQNPIHLRNFEMMEKIQEQGHVIALCTGRNSIDILPTINKIKIPYDYLVLSNGGQIYDSNHQPIVEKTIDSTIAKALLRECIQKPRLRTYFSNGKECVVFEEGVTKILSEEGFNKASKDILYYIEKSTIFHIIGISQIDSKTDYLDEFAKEYLVNYHNDISWYSNTKFIDIVPYGCSKGVGLLSLTEYLKNQVHTTYAVGDSFNDISMFEASHHSYTFKHCEEEIKQAAENIVDYVYNVCEDILK